MSRETRDTRLHPTDDPFKPSGDPLSCRLWRLSEFGIDASCGSSTHKTQQRQSLLGFVDQPRIASETKQSGRLFAGVKPPGTMITMHLALVLAPMLNADYFLRPSSKKSCSGSLLPIQGPLQLNKTFSGTLPRRTLTIAGQGVSPMVPIFQRFSA